MVSEPRGSVVGIPPTSDKFAISLVGLVLRLRSLRTAILKGRHGVAKLVLGGRVRN